MYYKWHIYSLGNFRMILTIPQIKLHLPFARYWRKLYGTKTVICNIALVMLTLQFICLFGHYLLYNTQMNLNPKPVRPWEHKLWMLKNKLYQAHRLARYISERNAIRQALFILHSMKLSSTEFSQSKSRDNIEKQQVGRTVELESDASLVQRVTVLLYRSNCEQADRLVRTIRDRYKSIHIQAAVATSSNRAKHLCQETKQTGWLFNVNDTSSTWATLAARATTDLVFVSRNLIGFSSKFDLQKLLSVFDWIQADVVGGAVRLEPESRWHAACYKTSLRNFTLRFHPGHDLSEPPCAYCDYIASPFIIRRDLFQRAMSQTSLAGVLSLVDLFLRLTHGHLLVDQIPKVLSCMDVMFHVAGPSLASGGQGLTQIPKSDWLHLARIWTLNQIILPDTIEHSWNCQKIGLNCSHFEQFGPSVLVPPCCLKERSRCIQSFLRLTKSLNISTGIFNLDTVRTTLQQRGTSLPWGSQYVIEWDASKAARLFRHLRLPKNGFPCHIEPSETDEAFGDQCALGPNATCLHHWLRSSGWRTKLIGRLNYLTQLTPDVLNPTRVNVYGFWIETYVNPGWIIQQKSSRTSLLTFESSKNDWNYQCPNNVAEHACLMRNAFLQGNIQFDALFI